jgi:hypothetical protein
VVSHRQAYFDSREPRAASPSLGPGALAALAELYTGEDGLRVDSVDALGMVATRTAAGFSHMLVGPFDGLLGIELWGADHWRAEGDEIEELPSLEPAPPELEPAPALLEAVLGGDPVVLVEPDEPRRAALIAWVCFALPRPEAERLTFATFSSRPTGVRLTGTTPEHAGAFEGLVVDGTTSAVPGHYTRIALELGQRGTLRDATQRLQAPDAIALAIAGGATDLLTPEDLPRALELITALATDGDVAIAARAAAAIPHEGESPQPEVPPEVVMAESDGPVSLRELEASLSDGISLRELEQSLRQPDEEGP